MKKASTGTNKQKNTNIAKNNDEQTIENVTEKINEIKVKSAKTSNKINDLEKENNELAKLQEERLKKTNESQKKMVDDLNKENQKLALELQDLEKEIKEATKEADEQILVLSKNKENIKKSLQKLIDKDLANIAIKCQQEQEKYQQELNEYKKAKENK